MRKRAILLLLCLALGCTAGGCGRKEEAKTLRFYAFDLGQADCILLKTDDACVMIDTAEEDDGADIGQRLSELGVERIDLLILTHYDKDHIGGAPYLLSHVPIGQVLMPDYAKDGKRYLALLEALETSGVPYTRIASDMALTVGDMHLMLRTAQGDAYASEDNDYSIVALLTFGQTRFLLAGDAEADRLGELIQAGDVSCDVLKVPHHGRYNENSGAFIEACAPSIAVICDSNKNPAEEALTVLLANAGAAVACTRDGDVVIESDGTSARLIP